MSIRLQLLVATLVIVIEKASGEYAERIQHWKTERLVIKREDSVVRHAGYANSASTTLDSVTLDLNLCDIQFPDLLNRIESGAGL